MINCLHICNDLLGSKVHRNLYLALEKRSIDQTVFYPSRKKTYSKVDQFLRDHDLNVIVSKPLRKYHRFLFRRKISFLYKELNAQTAIEDFDVVHATTLFSDGALALKIHKKFKIPFIVAVRETDIGVFLKKRPDLLPLAMEILNKSSHIIFIADSLKAKFFAHPYLKKRQSQLHDKCLIIYNGIDDFWRNNLVVQKAKVEKQTKILYVGSLLSRKNVIALANAVLRLNSSGTRCTLTVVGEGGKDYEAVRELEKNNESITYLGAVSNHVELQKIYERHDIFAMPSEYETFGLVYVEALSQGLPILFSQNEGIDGVFDFKVGERCKSGDIDSIADGLKKLIDNKDSYPLNKIDFSSFDWSRISAKYLELYEGMI